MKWLNDFSLPRWLVIPICTLPWIFGAFILVWILTLRFPLSGVFKVESSMTGQSAFIYPFLPGERTTSPGKQADGWSGQRIIGDPVYMNARTPGPYDTVEVEMDFRALRQPLVEFGLVRDAEGKELDLYPWYSEMLEQPAWQIVKDNQKVLGYISSGISPKRLASSDTRGLAIWGTTTTSPLMADDNLLSSKKTIVSLRGSHDFWVVPTQGQIDFQMEIQDVNRNRSGGIMAWQVTRDGNLVLQDVVNTGGSMDRGYGAVIPVTIRLKSLEPGVYRIKVMADDDVFIRSIATRNPRWVVGPRLVVGDIVGFATTSTNALKAWTTARHIVAETFHKEGLQDVQFGPTKGSVKRTHTAVRIDRTDPIVEPIVISATHGDIRLVADGYFAFSPETFFEPQPRKLTPQTDGSKEGIQAVLTPYVRVQDLGDGWKRASLTLPITPDLDTLRFVLSAPGIASRAGSVDIRHVALTYCRPPVTWRTWWSLLLAEAKRAWHRL
ncbi:MAG: hypothetical protein PHC53_01925 [Patescibacteria group bacterium]|nr:hypothetical protein [Patescibacteria group bacterium]